MASLADIVIDCHHPAALARFWAGAIDGYGVARYDHAEIDRLASLGIDDVEDDPTVLVQADTEPRLWFQRVGEPKTAKNRVHLDVRADDPNREVARLIGLGARVLDARPDGADVVAGHGRS